MLPLPLLFLVVVHSSVLLTPLNQFLLLSQELTPLTWHADT
jgi:hypothetical protein